MSNELNPHTGETPVWGAKAIGAVIGKTERATFHLLESGALPAAKIGGQWGALPSRLRAKFTGEAA